MQNPSFDILMAVYNNEEYIREQLDSLIHQTYPHFRIVIRDDASSDTSALIIQEFIKKYPGKIHFLKGEKNVGALGNFAALMLETRANYVMFCDADDIWLPNKVEESLALIQKNEALFGAKTPLLIHTDLHVVDKELKTLSPSFWHYSQLNPNLALDLNRLVSQNVITGCTMLINKPLLELAIPIPHGAIMHDWWIGLVASSFGRIDLLPKPTILYRQHGKNDTGAKDCKSMRGRWNHVKKGFFQNGRLQMRNRLKKTIDQADLFLNRYEKQLNDKQRMIVKNYAALNKVSSLERRYLFLKYRYFKNSFAKNAAMFLLL